MPSKKAAGDISAATSRILEAPDVQNAWGAFAQGMQSLGMTHFVYGATRIPSWGIIGNGDDALILHHGPQGYVDAYVDEKLYLDSPTYNWAATHDGFVSWQVAVAQTPLTNIDHQKRILALNFEYGVTGGFVGSLNKLVPGMRGVIGISPGGYIPQAEADKMWSTVGADVEMLCKLMHLRIASLPQTHLRRPLTSRQREALHWSSEGKTMQDVATIMDLSVGTVEKHLRMAREALGAQTTAHAVQKAVSHNLLTLEV